MHPLLDLGLRNALLATVLAGFAAGVCLVCRRPALRHSLWLLVLLKLVTPPLVPIPVPWPAAVEPILHETVLAPAADVAETANALETRGEAVAAAESAVPAPTDLPSGEEAVVVLDLPGPEEPRVQPVPAASEPVLVSPAWLNGLAFVWLISALACLLWTLWRVCCFQRLLRHARPAPAELQRQTDQLAGRLGLRSRPVVYLVAGAVSPMVWGIGSRSRLLFPARLLERLDREQRATLLVHELAHIRRRDHWVRLLELLVQGLYWWHPLFWWARRELHEAEEQCCDAWVVSILKGAGHAYAVALLQTVAFVSHAPAPLPVGASGIGQVSHLRRRLTMIMQGKTPRSLSWAGCLVVLAAVALLPMLPVQAEDKDKILHRVDVIRTDAKDGSIDSEIARLKEQIKALEEKKKAEQAKAQIDLKKLEAEAQQLRQQIEVKRRELAQLQKRYGDVTLELEKHRPSQPGGPWRIEIRQQGDESRGQPLEKRYIHIKAKPDILEVVPLEQKRFLELHRALVEKAQEAGPAQPGAKKPGDLEQKLDRLLKEVEDLRRELRERPRSRTLTPPGSP
jgi:beta-lactamase regulating signal transducer with metallopeptidase domain